MKAFPLYAQIISSARHEYVLKHSQIWVGKKQSLCYLFHYKAISSDCIPRQKSGLLQAQTFLALKLLRFLFELECYHDYSRSKYSIAQHTWWYTGNLHGKLATTSFPCRSLETGLKARLLKQY